jgi:D-arabinose 1-dehydrogenase-like Zn-dependent alcohol dehydrogenase
MTSAEAGKGIAGVVTMASGIATILANIASAITYVKGAKFATGGDVSGEGTTTSDSVPAMLSDGESVINAKSTAAFAPLLSAINQAGGGVPIYGKQAGGAADVNSMMKEATKEAFESMPAPVVSVVDITDATNRVKIKERIAKMKP